MENMTFAKFEGLSRRAYGALRKISDEDSLLRQACGLLEAGVALLVVRSGAGESATREVIRIWPAHTTGLSAEEQGLLWSWYSSADILPDSEGFTRGTSIRIGETEYPDMLVTFCSMQAEGQQRTYELFLLQKPGAEVKYSSYQCWAASLLLRQFDYATLPIQLQKAQSDSNLLASSITVDAIPQETWKSLCRRVKDLPPDQRGCFFAVWAGYQRRRMRLDSTGPDDWQEAMTEWKKREDIFDRVCLSLAEDKEMCETCYILQDSLFTDGTQDQTKRKFLVQASIVFLEHAWKAILSWAEPRRSSPLADTDGDDKFSTELQGKADLACSLLALTRALAIEELAMPAGRSIPPAGKARLGKSFHWLYLAAILTTTSSTSSSRLARLYLDECDHPDKNEPHTAPPELRRQFLLQLARCMLGVVGRLQTTHGIRWRSHDTEQSVTAIEEMEGLVFMVDRFAHVELGVSERLSIRQHLARQINAEVGQYMSRNRYRDHLLHVIDVFLLGHLLLGTELTWINNDRRPLVEHLTALDSGDSKCMPKLAADWMRNWAIASLLHDIGYQLGQGSSVSKDGKAWTEYFNLPGNVPVRIPCSGGISLTPEAQAEFGIELGTCIANRSGLADVLGNLDSDTLKDHGILSALRVGQILGLPWGGDKAGNNLERHQAALHAIASHNRFDEPLRLRDYPLTCLLRLCDELQEWGRTRINLEKVTKQLYLNLQDGEFSKFPSYELVDFIDINITLSPEKESHIPGAIRSVLQETPHPGLFRFDLLYHDSVSASFDATMTLLSKAYSLQRLDFYYPPSPQCSLGFLMTLKFPKPFNFGRLMEYDILAMFAEESRTLPLLSEFPQIRPEKPGLMRLRADKPRDGKRYDCFGIVRVGEPNPTNEGWLEVNPDYLFADFEEFKKNILRERGNDG